MRIVLAFGRPATTGSWEPAVVRAARVQRAEPVALTAAPRSDPTGIIQGGCHTPPRGRTTLLALGKPIRALQGLVVHGHHGQVTDLAVGGRRPLRRRIPAVLTPLWTYQEG